MTKLPPLAWGTWGMGENFERDESNIKNPLF